MATIAAAFNDNESPLMRLYLRKGQRGETYIDAEQFAAGERLRRDFERSMLGPRVTFGYHETVSTSPGSNQTVVLADSAIEARNRFRAAMGEVGPELSGILYDVVCIAAGLEHAERRLKLPVRSGKAVLALALTRLARHYGIKPKPRSERESAATWHLPDFRPSIMPARQVAE